MDTRAATAPSYDYKSVDIPKGAYRDLLHDFNNDVGVAIGVLDAMGDSAEISPALRRLVEAGLQRLLHARETLRTLRETET